MGCEVGGPYRTNDNNNVGEFSNVFHVKIFYIFCGIHAEHSRCITVRQYCIISGQNTQSPVVPSLVPTTCIGMLRSLTTLWTGKSRRWQNPRPPVSTAHRPAWQNPRPPASTAHRRPACTARPPASTPHLRERLRWLQSSASIWLSWNRV